jgi:glycosyltransferase involved in cell wall biosynthesis
LRVLIASDFFAPSIGGAERQVQLLARELRRRGHETAIATVWQPGLAEESVDDGTPVHRLRAVTTRVPWFSQNPGRRFHPPFPDPEVSARLAVLLSRFQPEIVHANGWIAYSCALALTGRDTPLMVSVRDYGYTCPTRTLLENGVTVSNGPIVTKCLRCAGRQYGPAKAITAVAGVFLGRPLLRRKVVAVHSVSSFVESVVKRDLGFSPQDHRPRFVCIPDIASTDCPPDSSTRTGIVSALPDEPYILFVGQLAEHKGLGVLLSAYGRLQSPPPLVLIGTAWGDTRQDFPEKVTVIRDAPHDAVMLAWRRCLFGVVPSVWPDPLPGVVREGMACGKAMIVTATGGNLDMVADDRTGLLVPPRDDAALALAMARLIAEPHTRSRLGAAARATLGDFNADAVARRFEDLYRDLKFSSLPA